LITSLEATSGEVYDGHHFCRLVDHDLEQKLPVDTYSGDKGYDDGNNHYCLELCGLHSAIRLKKTRTEKKELPRLVKFGKHGPIGRVNNQWRHMGFIVSLLHVIPHITECFLTIRQGFIEVFVQIEFPFLRTGNCANVSDCTG
jgi:hypothetical protein